MSIEITCATCKATLVVKDQYSGTVISCRFCDEDVPVPSPTIPPLPVPAQKKKSSQRSQQTRTRNHSGSSRPSSLSGQPQQKSRQKTQKGFQNQPQSSPKSRKKRSTAQSPTVVVSYIDDLDDDFDLEDEFALENARLGFSLKEIGRGIVISLAVGFGFLALAVKVILIANEQLTAQARRERIVQEEKERFLKELAQNNQKAPNQLERPDWRQLPWRNDIPDQQGKHENNPQIHLPRKRQNRWNEPDLHNKVQQNLQNKLENDDELNALLFPNRRKTAKRAGNPNRPADEQSLQLENQPKPQLHNKPNRDSKRNTDANNSVANNSVFNNENRNPLQPGDDATDADPEQKKFTAEEQALIDRARSRIGDQDQKKQKQNEAQRVMELNQPFLRNDAGHVLLGPGFGGLRAAHKKMIERHLRMIEPIPPERFQGFRRDQQQLIRDHTRRILEGPAFQGLPEAHRKLLERHFQMMEPFPQERFRGFNK